ncbi:Gephyrin [Chelonia mydas]|uniref:Gephyrin n=1 Tax=Chelonia mydas TaxID=8469 RepID=M7CIZ6_CHEMY|nr:Gephyrin [Chelonia mydas]
MLEPTTLVGALSPSYIPALARKKRAMSDSCFRNLAEDRSGINLKDLVQDPSFNLHDPGASDHALSQKAMSNTAEHLLDIGAISPQD